MNGRGVRPNPCPSCPYRVSVPSGVWAPEEYAKLLDYDKPIGEQSPRAFNCHQGDGRLCAGWVGFGDPRELLALRLGVAAGRIDPEVLDYRTEVPLFASGLDAAEWGMAYADAPGQGAIDAIAKITRVRSRTDNPVIVRPSDSDDPPPRDGTVIG